MEGLRSTLQGLVRLDPEIQASSFRKGLAFVFLESGGNLYWSLAILGLYFALQVRILPGYGLSVLMGGVIFIISGMSVINYLYWLPFDLIGVNGLITTVAGIAGGIRATKTGGRPPDGALETRGFLKWSAGVGLVVVLLTYILGILLGGAVQIG